MVDTFQPSLSLASGRALYCLQDNDIEAYRIDTTLHQLNIVNRLQLFLDDITSYLLQQDEQIGRVGLGEVSLSVIEVAAATNMQRVPATGRW